MESATGRGRRSLAERRQQLLDAAVEVMAARGIAGTTTRAITEAAGVPQGIFHYCFDSKAALLRMLLERESERASATAWQVEPSADALGDAVFTAIHAQLARVRAEPKQFQVLAELSVVARTDPELHDLIVNERRLSSDLVASLLRHRRPDQSDDELRQWAAVIVAGIDGLTESWLTVRDDEASIAAATLFARTVADALESNDGAAKR